LAKKVLIADSVADFSTPIFEVVKAGGQPMLFEAWCGALAYTFQLYFDFSAYSDMAIGLSLMFNVRLPMNFNSPYKATSIIEFWRRWHMTLSRFSARLSLYPAGWQPQRSRPPLFEPDDHHAARRTLARRRLDVCDLGGLHGFYLIVNHAWRYGKRRMGWGAGGRLANLGAGALTFLVVVIGWVFFPC
jgi:D-alanyl-lipoteichoic acid acyltransferase DltB (MBOAT superfamily)